MIPSGYGMVYELENGGILLIHPRGDGAYPGFIFKNREEFAKDVEYQSLIASGLERFNDYDLDTEDREKLCGYFEDILDAIDLESSGGAINTWLYGFDV